jgi:uncharacterized repeat protein (TIGR01451 family)
MKYTLPLLFCFLSIFQAYYSQVTGFALSGLNLSPNAVLTSCDQEVNIGFSALTPATNSTVSYDLPYTILGNNFSGFQFQAVVDWGDGSNTIAGGGTSTAGTNISMNPPLSHLYNAPGSYVITTTVYNPANQTYAFDSLYYTVGSCSYQAYAAVGLDCNNDGTVEQNLQNVPFQLISNNGQVYQNNNQTGGLLQFTNLTPGTYTLQVDPSWLAASGYVVLSSFPTTPIVLPGPGITTYMFTLICNQGAVQLCVGGTVFCDANNNGIFDSNEPTVNNVPIVVNGITTYSNANGQYNASFAGVAGQYYPIEVNANYLSNTQNTVSASAPDSVLAYPCSVGAPPIPANIPMNCSSPSNVFCYGGYVFCDDNGNGVFDTNESPIAFAPVILYTQNSTSNSVTVYTDSLGYFSYCGSFTNTTNLIMAQVSSTWLAYNGIATSPILTLLGSNNGQINYGMLAINCGGQTTTCADMWTTVTPWIGYYQGTTAYIKLNWGNYGPQAANNYTLSLTYPAGVTPNTASIQNSGYTISGNTITWNLYSSSTFFNAYDVITFNVPSGLASGTQHIFSSTINPTGTNTDCAQFNNQGSLLQIVGNSYDPNDKTAATLYNFEGSVCPPDYLDYTIIDQLTYTIRFQNTGTAPAQNIYIIDTLSPNLDLNTFTLLESTHPIQVVNLGNGIFRFEFNQIWLPDSLTNEPASHGHFTYRIIESASNQFGSVIDNTAYIYFDWNDPIITNTTHHVNSQIENVHELTSPLQIHPNPATKHIELGLESPEVVLIKDINGKTVYQELVAPNQYIDIEHLKNGIYFIESKNKFGKLIKI